MTIVRVVFVVAAYLTFATNDVMARQWFIEPDVAIYGGYEDNPYFVSDSEDAVIDDVLDTDERGSQSFVDIGGSMKIGSESASNTIAFDAAAYARRYEDSILDTERLLASLFYEKIGLQHDWSVTGGYIKRDSISSFLGEPGGDIVLDNFGRFRGDRQQQEVFITPTLTSRFSTNWLGELTFGYRNVTYDELVDMSLDYEDFRVRYQLRRILSERVSVFGLTNILSYRPTEPAGLGVVVEENAADLQLGIDYIASERLSLLFSAGPGYIETEIFETEGEGAIRASDTVPIGTATIVYDGQRSTFTAGISANFESGVSTGITKNRRISVGYTRPETLGGELSLSAYYLERDPVLVSIDRNYFAATAGMAWGINQYLSLWTDIQFREQEVIDIAIVDNSTDTANSTAFRVGLRYVWGRKLLKQ